jgi:putative exosortase-associated protein (TIGR04073 family)
MRRTALLAALTLLALPVTAHGRTDAEQYTAATKLGRGLAAVTTGFLELPGNVIAVAREQGTVGGMTIGLAKGIGMIPVRELVGAYDIVSSPFAPPGNYDPVLDPAYPWRYFEGAPDARMSAAMTGETRYASRSRSTTHATSGASR